MREIKFRAWDVANNEMIYHGSFQFEQFPKLPIGPQNLRQRIFPFDGIESGEMCVGDPLNGWHLMQFTGLLDKNGKEIYEGDIVKSIQIIDGNWVEGIIETYEVVFEGCSFQYKPIEYRQYKQYTVSPVGCSVEVIGNIHENSDLLK